MIPIQTQQQLMLDEPAAIIVGCRGTAHAETNDQLVWYRVPINEYKEALNPLTDFEDHEFDAMFFTKFPLHGNDFDERGYGATWRSVDISDWSLFNWRLEAFTVHAGRDDYSYRQLKALQAQLFRYDSPEVVSYRMIAALLLDDLKESLIQAMTDKADELYEEHGTRVIAAIKSEFDGEVV